MLLDALVRLLAPVFAPSLVSPDRSNPPILFLMRGARTVATEFPRSYKEAQEIARAVYRLPPVISADATDDLRLALRMFVAGSVRLVELCETTWYLAKPGDAIWVLLADEDEAAESIKRARDCGTRDEHVAVPHGDATASKRSALPRASAPPAASSTLGALLDSTLRVRAPTPTLKTDVHTPPRVSHYAADRKGKLKEKEVVAVCSTSHFAGSVHATANEEEDELVRQTLAASLGPSTVPRAAGPSSAQVASDSTNQVAADPALSPAPGALCKHGAPLHPLALTELRRMFLGETDINDEDEDDPVVHIRHHKQDGGGHLVNVDYDLYEDLDPTVGELHAKAARATGWNRDSFSLIDARASLFDHDKSWKRVSRWSVKAGDDITLCRGQQTVVCVWVEPRKIRFTYQCLFSTTYGQMRADFAQRLSVSPADLYFAHPDYSQGADKRSYPPFPPGGEGDKLHIGDDEVLDAEPEKRWNAHDRTVYVWICSETEAAARKAQEGAGREKGAQQIGDVAEQEEQEGENAGVRSSAAVQQATLALYANDKVSEGGDGASILPCGVRASAGTTDAKDDPLACSEGTGGLAGAGPA